MFNTELASNLKILKKCVKVKVINRHNKHNLLTVVNNNKMTTCLSQLSMQQSTLRGPNARVSEKAPWSYPSLLDFLLLTLPNIPWSLVCPDRLVPYPYGIMKVWVKWESGNSSRFSLWGFNGLNKLLILELL